MGRCTAAGSGGAPSSPQSLALSPACCPPPLTPLTNCRPDPGTWESCLCSDCTGTALYCTVLHCTALHCTSLYCTVPHCNALYCTVLHCTALYCTVLHCTALYRTVLHCTALYCTCTALYCTVQYHTDILTADMGSVFLLLHRHLMACDKLSSRLTQVTYTKIGQNTVEITHQPIS